MYPKHSLLVLFLCALCVIIVFTIAENRFLSGEVELRPTNNIDDERKNPNKLLNLSNFEYVINTSCDNASMLVWIITSYAGDVSSRSALRRAYPSKQLTTMGIRRIFLLALLNERAELKSEISQNAILDEARKFRDIVQGNFVEAYRNLTYKHLMGLRWTTDNCQGVPYVMKMDHDIIVNLYDVSSMLKKTGIPPDTLMGYVLGDMVPVREPANKWFVTRQEYAEDVYPDFLSGWLYLADLKTIEKLVMAAQNYPKYFWIDDVFLTGIVRENSDVKTLDVHELYTTNYEYLRCCLRDVGKRLKCEFAIGPNGGDVELQVAFQKFSDYCRSNCYVRPKELSANNTCIVG